MPTKICFALPLLLLAACGGPAPTTPPADTSTETQPAPAESPKITLAQYEQVAEGMTLAEVEAILGQGTELSSSEIGGIKTVIYQWEGQGSFGANMNVTVQDGTAIAKAQFGLK